MALVGGYVFGLQRCATCGAEQDAYWPISLAGSSALQCGTCESLSCELAGVGHLVTAREHPRLAEMDVYDLSAMWFESRRQRLERRVLMH